MPSSVMAIRLNQADFTHLAEFLTHHVPTALKVYSTVLNAIQGRVQLGIWVDVWPNPQAVVAKPEGGDKHSSNAYSLFALDQEALGNLLHDTVETTHWQSSVVFAGIPKEYFPTLEEVANEHGCQLDSLDLNCGFIFYANKEDFIFDFRSLPKDITVGHLTEAHAPLVNSNWKFSNTEDCLAYVKSTIENFPSVALFDAKGDVVAYEMMMYYGAIGMLHVMPQHRRKGYATYVTSALAQKVFAIGMTPFALIEECNKTSSILHEKMGFKKFPDMPLTWVTAKAMNLDSSDCILRKYCV